MLFLTCISFTHTLNYLLVDYLLLGEINRYLNTKSHQHSLVAWGSNGNGRIVGPCDPVGSFQPCDSMIWTWVWSSTTQQTKQTGRHAGVCSKQLKAEGTANSLNCSQSSSTFCFLLIIFTLSQHFPLRKEKPTSEENPNASTVFL